METDPAKLRERYLDRCEQNAEFPATFRRIIDRLLIELERRDRVIAATRCIAVGDVSAATSHKYHPGEWVMQLPSDNGRETFAPDIYEAYAALVAANEGAK